MTGSTQCDRISKTENQVLVIVGGLFETLTSYLQADMTNTYASKEVPAWNVTLDRFDTGLPDVIGAMERVSKASYYLHPGLPAARFHL